MDKVDALQTIADHLFDYSEVEKFDTCSPSEKVFIAVYELEAEINNGGFDQYYLNSAGNNAEAAPAAFRAIGATKTAAIIEKANRAAFPEGVPRDREERLGIMEAWSEEHPSDVLSACDDEFYEYADDLESLLYRYAEKNKAAIRGAEEAFLGSSLSVVDRIKGLFGR